MANHLCQPGETLCVAVTQSFLSELVGWQMRWKPSSEAFLSSFGLHSVTAIIPFVQVAPDLPRPQAGVAEEA